MVKSLDVPCKEVDVCAMCWTVVFSISALRDSRPFLLVMAAPPSLRMMVVCLVGSDGGDVKFMKNFCGDCVVAMGRLMIR